MIATGMLIAGCAREDTVYEPSHPYSSVLVFGNSITKHDIVSFWWGEWGMAASVREKDFVHQLENMLQLTNPACTVTGYEIADWERNHRTFDKSEFDSYFSCKPDLIIIRLGENVYNETGFDLSIQSMIDYIKTKAPGKRIVITGVFWTDSSKELILQVAAVANNLTFVELASLNVPENKSYIGATVFDEEGNPHLIDHAGVAAHPNDKGMKAIADAIFDAILNVR